MRAYVHHRVLRDRPIAALAVICLSALVISVDAHIALQMALLGSGLGFTAALATDKAAVGSAVNDRTRELGGTLGVAIVGILFASVYSRRPGTDSVLAALPADVRSAMEQSVAAALRLVGQLPAGRITDVHDAVNRAFLDGLQVGSLVYAAIALGAAVIVVALLPARARRYGGGHRRVRQAAPAVVAPEPMSARI